MSAAAAGAGRRAARGMDLLRLWRAGLPPAVLFDFGAAHGLKPEAVVARLERLVGLAALDERALSPLEKAARVLVGRAVEDRRAPGGWRLDGRPAGPQAVVATANRLLGRWGRPPIDYPGVHPAEGRAPCR